MQIKVEERKSPLFLGSRVVGGALKDKRKDFGGGDADFPQAVRITMKNPRIHFIGKRWYWRGKVL
jgi:hypothetical protein